MNFQTKTRNSDRDLSLLESDPDYDLYHSSHHVMLRHQHRINHQHPHSASGFLQVHRLQLDDAAEDEVSGGRSQEDTNPNLIRWISAMDIYALGIILFEFGLWRGDSSLKGTVSTPNFVNQILDTLVDSLDHRGGELYQGLTRKCLRLGDLVDDELKVKEFFAEASETLGLCRAQSVRASHPQHE